MGKTFELDVKPWAKRVDNIEHELADRTKLHEMIVIRLQGVVFRKFESLQPALSELTLETRGGSAPLQDKGTFKQSLTGVDPKRVSTAPGTLNAVTRDASTIGTNIPGAYRHYKGGWIRAVNVKNLAIPVTKEARKAGGPRKFKAILAVWPARKGATKKWLVLGEKFTPKRGKYKGQERTRPIFDSGGDVMPQFYLTPEIYEPARDYWISPEEGQTEALKVGKVWLKQLAAGQAIKPGAEEG